MPERIVLPVRPQPATGESIAGYLMRVASANGFGSVSQLCATAAKTGHEPLKVIFEWLILSQQARSHPFGVLPRRWFSAQPPLGLSIADFNHSFRRWCPICLTERPVLKGAWGLKLVCACDVHSVWLNDTCPRCGESQRWAGTEFLRCHCGARLGDAAANATDETVVRLTRALLGTFSVHPSEPWSGMSTAAWHRAVRYLGGFAAATRPNRPGQHAHLHRMTHAGVLVSGTAWLLDSWPKNFDGMLKTFQRPSGTAQNLQQAFSPLYRVLYVKLTDPCFQFLRDAFEAHLHEHWWGLICQRNRRLNRGIIETHPRLGLKQAALAAGLPPSVIRHMVQAELLPSVSTTQHRVRRASTIHLADIAPLRALCSDAATLSEAARMLALPEARLRQLIASGLIQPLISRGGKSRSARWSFTQQELARLHLHGPDDGLPLRHVLRYTHLTEAELLGLVAAIIEGSFDDRGGHLTEDQPLGQVRVRQERLKSWLAEKRLSEKNGMSIDAAAKKLGVKQQVAYCLVRHGLLGSMDGGQLGRRVLDEHLKLFSESYVSLKELARTYRVSPRAMLKRILVAPASGPAIDGNRQIFFQRLENCRLIMPQEAISCTSM